MMGRPQKSTLFPYTPPSRSQIDPPRSGFIRRNHRLRLTDPPRQFDLRHVRRSRWFRRMKPRSGEHTSELQSLTNLVCRLLLEKKKKTNNELSDVRHVTQCVQ